MECRCATEADPEPMGLVEAEVCVTEERGIAMWEKVEMRALRRGFCSRLQDVPEEGEIEACDCCETRCDGEGWELMKLDDCDRIEKEEMNGDVLELDVVRWAVDVGIWVACLGVGLLVSKASSRRLRRLILL
ncbi:hypothetical protein HPP92_007394 [Vanilla planifolia]|uniref:Uncharacterized protein n=1 Tax=Vanilla planifolia TaxID=51239 RepID=A0A835RLV2_VANPL|nr:hypothetical protein HPP92_007394 [Vanilla planifolia]